MNSNVIRGGGLIVLAGCYVAVERTFTNSVVNDGKQLQIETIGGGRGSMYNVRIDFAAISLTFFLSFTQVSSSLSFCQPPFFSFLRLARVIARHCKS